VASDATGLLSKFFTWVTKAAGSGGPAWTILLDKSANPVLTTYTVPSFGDSKLHAVAHGLYTGDLVILSNSGGSVPGGLTNGNTYFVIKVDADNFRLATTLLNCQLGSYVTLTNAGTGTNYYLLEGPYIIVSDQVAPTTNQSCMILKVRMVSTEAAYIRVQYWMSFDTTNKVLYGLWGGYRIPTYDSADFAYDFRGGSETLIIQSRLGTSWSTALIDTWVGDSNLVEGIDKTGTLQSGVTAGSSVVLPLSSGQEINFTVNKYYYIYDFNGHSWVNYCKCTAVDTGAHTITVDAIQNNFPTGSVIAAYAHRFYLMGDGTVAGSPPYYLSYTYAKLKVPYVSAAAAYVFYSQEISQIYGGCELDKMANYLTQMTPNDEGVYAVQKPSICEYYGENSFGITTGMNRCYGVTKNVYMTYTGVMAQGQDGRTIGGKNYLYFRRESDITYFGSTVYALLFLDTSAVS
jgi:hypothetical protein